MSDYTPLTGGDGTPSRVVGANIPFDWLVYIFGILAVIALAIGIILRVRMYRRGKREKADIQTPSKFRRVLYTVGLALSQKKVISSLGISGVFHALLVWSLIVLLLTAAVDASSEWLGWPVMEGMVYMVHAFIGEFAGVTAFVGAAGLACTRYISHSARMEGVRVRSILSPLAFALVFLTGFILEGARIAAQMDLSADPSMMAYEQIASPVGYLFALMLGSAGADAVLTLHRYLWWIHAFIAFAGIVLIPYGRMWHAVGGWTSAYKNDDTGALRNIKDVESLEDEHEFGAHEIRDLIVDDLADLDACTECGLCRMTCPANQAGYVLNPKQSIILNLQAERKRTMHIVGGDASEGSEDGYRPLSQVIGKEPLWSCITCRACVEICPINVNHISKLIDIRRYVTMWESEPPEAAQSAFVNLERNANPWGIGFAQRVDWLERAQVQDIVHVLEPGEDASSYDYVLFAGCFAAYDVRYRQVIAAAVYLLNEQGVSLAYLGSNESCCGDSARRLGNEYLYQELAQKNIEMFKSCNVQRIVTLCPHCLQTLKNEYPDLDNELSLEVFHIMQILDVDKLKVQGIRTDAGTVLVQEPCYLARYNKDANLSADILKKCGIVTVDSSAVEGATCCGGGGGCMWLDDAALQKAQRVSEKRADAFIAAASQSETMQPSKAGADEQEGQNSQETGQGATIVTSCPYCLTMLTDALADKDDASLQVKDICEVLWEEEKKLEGKV